MEAALHAHHRHATQMPEDHPAGVALHRANRKVRDALVREHIGVDQLFGQRAEPAAADDADARPQSGALQQIVGDRQQRLVRVPADGMLELN